MDLGDDRSSWRQWQRSVRTASRRLRCGTHPEDTVAALLVLVVGSAVTAVLPVEVGRRLLEPVSAWMHTARHVISPVVGILVGVPCEGGCGGRGRRASV